MLEIYWKHRKGETQNCLIKKKICSLQTTGMDQLKAAWFSLSTEDITRKNWRKKEVLVHYPIQLKKKGKLYWKNYGTKAMNKPIERKLVFQEVLKFIIFTCSIPVQLIQGVNNAIQQINLYPIDCTVCFVKIHLQDSDLSLGKHYPPLGQLHWPVLDLKKAASSLSTVTNWIQY